MAKVGTETYIAVGSQRVEYSIYYSKTAGFTAKIPDPIFKAKGAKEQQLPAKDYDDAKKVMDAYLAEYYAAEVKISKVLAYYLAYRIDQGLLHRLDPDKFKHPGGFVELATKNAERSWSYSHNKISHQLLSIDYRVLYLIEYHGQKFVAVNEPKNHDFKDAMRYRTSDPTRPHSGYGSDQDYNAWELLDYTPELEEWFKATVQGLQLLVGKVVQFFGTQSDHLLESIAQGGNLLGTAKEMLETSPNTGRNENN